MKIETIHLRSCTDCGSTAEICERFEEQPDGDPENRVSDYCGSCGHSRDCHESKLDSAVKIIRMIAAMPASTHAIDQALCQEWLEANT